MSELSRTFMGDQTEELGPGYLDWDTAIGGQNLSLGDFDSITIRFSGTKTPLVGSQYGTEPKDQVLTGVQCEVECGMGQASPARMKEVFQIVEFAEDSSSQLIQMAGVNPIGQKDSTLVKQMTFTRQLDGVKSTYAGDIVDFWRIAPAPTAELVYDAATQRFVKLTFRGYADDTKLAPSGVATFWKTRDISQ